MKFFENPFKKELTEKELQKALEEIEKTKAATRQLEEKILRVSRETHQFRNESEKERKIDEAKKKIQHLEQVLANVRDFRKQGEEGVSKLEKEFKGLDILPKEKERRMINILNITKRHLNRFGFNLDDDMNSFDKIEEMITLKIEMAKKELDDFKG